MFQCLPVRLQLECCCLLDSGVISRIRRFLSTAKFELILNANNKSVVTLDLKVAGNATRPKLHKPELSIQPETKLSSGVVC